MPLAGSELPVGITRGCQTDLDLIAPQRYTVKQAGRPPAPEKLTKRTDAMPEEAQGPGPTEGEKADTQAGDSNSLLIEQLHARSGPRRGCCSCAERELDLGQLRVRDIYPQAQLAFWKKS